VWASEVGIETIHLYTPWMQEIAAETYSPVRLVKMQMVEYQGRLMAANKHPLVFGTPKEENEWGIVAFLNVRPLVQEEGIQFGPFVARKRTLIPLPRLLYPDRFQTVCIFPFEFNWEPED